MTILVNGVPGRIVPSLGVYGVLPAEFADDGDEPSPLANDLPSLTDRALSRWLWTWLSPLPISGTTLGNDRGAYALVDPDDGTHTQAYRIFVKTAAGAWTVADGSDYLIITEVGEESYSFTPAGLAVQVQTGAVSWTYTPPAPTDYTFTPAGIAAPVSIGNVSWSYDAPVAENYSLTPFGLQIDVTTGAVAWVYAPASVIDTGEPITLAQAKGHVNLIPDEPHPDDEMLTGFITAARQAAELYTGRIYTSATREWLVEGFWARMPFPGAPVGQVVSVRYYDTDGVLQTLSPSQFRLYPHSDHPELIVKLSGLPALLDGPGSVVISFTGGHGPSNPVPALAIAAMKLTIGHLYANREDVVVGASVADLPTGARALLWPYRRDFGV